MARIFTDGAEIGDTKFWDNTQTNAVTTPTPLKGTYSYRLFQGASKHIPLLSELYFRGRFMYTSSPVYHFAFRDNTVSYQQLLLEVDTGIQRLIVTNGSNVGYTSASSYPVNTWVLIEVHFKLHSSSGVIEVKMDGNLQYSFTGNTLQSYPSTVGTLYVPNSNSGQFYVDDLALNDTTGGSDNSWCGEGYVISIAPNAAGDVNDFTNSGATSQTNNYSYVDEIPPSGGTDYVYSSNTADKDLYNIGTYDFSGYTITRAFVEARAKSSAAVGDEIKLKVKTNGTEYDSSPLALSNSYARIVGSDYTTNPDSGFAWSQGDIDALQIGQEVV